MLTRKMKVLPRWRLEIWAAGKETERKKERKRKRKQDVATQLETLHISKENSKIVGLRGFTYKGCPFDLLVRVDRRQGWKIRGQSDRKWAVLRVCSTEYTLSSYLHYFGWILICIGGECYSANLIPMLGQTFEVSAWRTACEAYLKVLIELN